MKKTITKRIVSLLAVVALLMTMFTGMVFSVSADDTVTETTTSLVPITDATKWTGKTDKITANGTFAAVKGEGNERVITTADTYDFGNKLKVSGTLIQRTVSGSQTAKSYVKVGDFRFEIEDDLTSFYVRAVMGEEVVYEESWTRAELDSMQYKHFYKVDFNATIDNTAKTVTLDYLTGNRYAAETVKETGSGTYTGDYSFDGVNCAASFKSNWLADGSNEVVGVLAFSVTKYETVADESSEDVSSEEVSSEVTSSEDVSSSGGAVVEKETTETFLPLPSADTTGWTGRGTERIAPEDIVIDGYTYAPQYSLANKVNSSGERPLTSTNTFDFGNKLKVSGTLVIHAYHPSYGAKAFVRVGDFKFEISDDTTNGYVKAYMGEEVVYNQSFALAKKSNVYVDTIFHQVKFNAVIDNTAKTVQLDYTTGPIDNLTDNTGSGVYTGDYTFDGVTVTASVTNNFCKDDNITGGTVNVAVPNFSVTKYETVAEESSEVTSSEDVSSEEVSSEVTSSEDVSSDATSSDDTSSETVVEKTANLVPITDASKWTGKTEKITANGTFASVTGEGSERVITTVDTFNFGNQLKVSGTLVQRAFSGNQTAKTYVKVGDFKFEIEDDLTSLYVRAVIGNETVYEKSWTRTELDSMLYKHFYKVDFNVTIDTSTKTVTLDYLTGNKYAAETVKETGSGTYTGDYSFDGVNCVASYKSNWMTNNGEEAVGVLDFDVTYYEVQEPVEVTVTVNAKNGREYTYTTDSYPTIEGMIAADATIKAAIQDVPGYNLTGWTTVDGTAVETNVALTEDITLVPVYTKATATYAVSIDGVVNNYVFNTYVTAVSDNAEFTSWTENSKVVSYAKEYSFFVGCDRTLTSVNSGAVAAQAIVSVNNAWTDGTYDYVLTEWALPEGCTLVAEGVIMTKDASVDLADKTLADVDGTTIRSSSTRLTTAAGQYLIYTNTNANFEAKAYLTYSDGTNQYTIYTDAVTVA